MLFHLPGATSFVTVYVSDAIFNAVLMYSLEVDLEHKKKIIYIYDWIFMTWTNNQDIKILLWELFCLERVENKKKNKAGMRH